MSRALDWEQRRALMVDRIARERDDLGERIMRVLQPIRRVETVTHEAGSALRQLRPLLLPVAVILFLRPTRTLRWMRRLPRWVSAYQIVRRARRFIG